jgi:mannose-6-phosphate isomerase-like protein (cupin superfamily)
MKIIKRESKDIPKEDAHGGAGSRKVYANSEHLGSQHFEATTHGYLPAGKIFDWHDHKNTDEIMIILKGSGKVFDDDGEYAYNTGDVYIFPSDVLHKIENTSLEENEMIFVRVRN